MKRETILAVAAKAMLLVVVLGVPASCAYAITSPLRAIQQRPSDIEGSYACTGKGPDGKSYDVDLAIEKQGDSYSLEWTVDGEATGIGVGLVKGSTLSAIFQTRNAVGLVTYAIGKNSLDGTWTLPQLEGLVMPEQCSPGSGPAKAV